MQSILENFYREDNKLVYDTFSADNLTAEQAIAYIQNLSYTLTQKIKEFSVQSKEDEVVRDLTFSVGALDVAANFKVWNTQALKEACYTLTDTRHNLLHNN